MPAETVHLSALARTTAEASPGLRALLERYAEEARLGAVLVDLPYFVRFPAQAVLFALKLPLSGSPWGDRFHVDAPQRVGIAMLDRARTAPREHRDAQLAFSLGYFSHLAIDTALHPLVNRLADRQVMSEGRDRAYWHREVEKFQSILFHEELNGFDFMGTEAIARYISVPVARLGDAVWRRFLDDSIASVLGASPRPSEWTSFARGYAQYVRLLASFVGARIAPAHAKVAARPLYFDTPEFRFTLEFERAVEVSNRYVNAAFEWFSSDGAAPTELLDVVGERSIDDPAQPARLKRAR